MRLNSIKIKNFRNYMGEHSFDLSHKYTILFGENGYGKSSFFDAIEWGLTGTISRFDDDNLKEDILNRYESSNNLECKVELEFEKYKLIRSFTFDGTYFKNTQVKIVDMQGIIMKNNNKEINSKQKVDDFLSTKFSGSVIKNNFGKMLKQTYILSQDQVTDFVVDDDPRQRFRSLANIMGLQQLLNLSDNLKKTLSQVKKQEEDLQREIQTIDKQVESKEETKVKMDPYEFNSKLSELGLNYSDNIKEQLHNIKNKRIEEKLYQNQKIKILKNIIEKNDSIKSLDIKITTLENETSSLKIKGEKVKEVQKAANIKEKDLKQMYKDFESQKYYQKKILEYQKILKTSNSLGKPLNELKGVADNYNDKLNSLYFAENRMHSYSKYSLELLTIPKTISQKQEKIKRLERKLSKREEMLVRIKALLLDHNDGLLKTLIDGILDVKSYLKKNKQTEVCPVCSTNKDGELRNIIEHNLNLNNELLESQSSYSEKLLSVKNTLSNKITRLNVEIKNENLELKELNGRYELIKEEISKIINNESFNVSFFKQDLQSVIKERENIEKNITSVNKAINTMMEMDKLKKKYNQTKFYNSFENEYALVHELNILSKALKRITSNLEIKRDDYRNKNKKLEELHKIKKDLVNYLENNEYEVPFVQLINTCNEIINKNKQVLDSIDKLESVKEGIDSNNNIEKQINLLHKNKNEVQVKLKYINNLIFELNKYKSNVFGDLGENDIDLLNEPNSPIQKYYRYLNPLPSNSLLTFKNEEDKLWINIQYENSKLENKLNLAKNVLSSGQLCVLAISIFLAINDSQDLHEIDFIGIDDPIQNMDDVNQYSICDVLSNVKKQLIFSTHDINFLKLFLKKNTHQISDIQVYNFQSPFLTKERVEKVSLI